MLDGVGKGRAPKVDIGFVFIYDCLLWCLRVGWWSPKTRSSTTMDPLGFTVSRWWQAAVQQSCHIPTSLNPRNKVRHMSFESGAETTYGFVRLRFQWWRCSHEESQNTMTASNTSSSLNKVRFFGFLWIWSSRTQLYLMAGCGGESTGRCGADKGIANRSRYLCTPEAR
jgi:hypothetical protein